MKNKIISAVFCLLLIAGIAGSILVPDKYYSENEKRTLKQFPDISLEAVSYTHLDVYKRQSLQYPQNSFVSFLAGAEATKETVIAYKNKLISENYAVRSINSMPASINSLLAFLGWTEYKAKSIKLQRQICL